MIFLWGGGCGVGRMRSNQLPQASRSRSSKVTQFWISGSWRTKEKRKSEVPPIPFSPDDHNMASIVWSPGWPIVSFVASQRKRTSASESCFFFSWEGRISCVDTGTTPGLYLIIRWTTQNGHLYPWEDWRRSIQSDGNGSFFSFHRDCRISDEM